MVYKLRTLQIPEHFHFHTVFLTRLAWHGRSCRTTVPLQVFFLFQAPQNESQEECSWLRTVLFWKLHDQMVRFSIKPDDQTDETKKSILLTKQD